MLSAFRGLGMACVRTRPSGHEERIMTERAEGSWRSRWLSGGAVALLVGLTALVIFIVQKTEPVEFRFLFLRFSWPVWLYTIVIALLGALVWFGLGVIRRHLRLVQRRRG
jgi:uncharacterized integral membrane protein